MQLLSDASSSAVGTRRGRSRQISGPQTRQAQEQQIDSCAAC